MNTCLKAPSMAAVSASATVEAAAGGGGLGMRIVRTKELGPAMWMHAAELAVTFKNGDIYVEKYVENTRHIEILTYRSSHRPLSALSTFHPLRWLIRLSASATTVRQIHGQHHRDDDADERDFGRGQRAGGEGLR